ncbi:MAG: glycogen/starch synthase, partial [bacterium]
MKILMVAPEVAPFVKVGGLADVVGALPKQFNGHDVRVVCPLYGSISAQKDWKAHDKPLVVHTGDYQRYGRIWETRLPDSSVPIYFIEHGGFFDRHEVYTGPWGSHADNAERFIFLSRAGLDICYHFHWFPDVIHAHDWPTALLPVMLNTTESRGPLSRTASVLTIHNLEHQGVFHPSLMPMTGLPDWTFRADGLESLGWANMLKGGIYHATKLTTVSPSYAREIQEPVGGCGLHDVLKFRSGDLVGILNGIDPHVWNPAVDALIPAKYSAGDLSGKAACKAELQRQFKLEEDPTIPIFGVISRFVMQKGLDLLRDVIGRVVTQMRAQFVVLGAG